MRHIISILLQNEAGALARVASLFSTRGYNIESLSVAPTEDPQVSRLTLVTFGSDEVISQINKQLFKLVDVVKFVDMTRGDHIERELILLKLRVNDGAMDVLNELHAQQWCACWMIRRITSRLELTGTGNQIDSVPRSR